MFILFLFYVRFATPSPVELCRDDPATKLFTIWILTYSEAGFSSKRYTLDDWQRENGTD